MRSKQILVAVVSALVLFCGCSRSSEKSAGRDYVNAARKVTEARDLFRRAEYSESLKLALSAKADVEKIVSDDPESAIALKVVTDPTTLIGVCEYRKLCDTVIPFLVELDAPEFKKVKYEWAIALAQNSSEMRDYAIRCAVERLRTSDSADFAKTEAALIARVSSPTVKSALLTSLPNVRANPVKAAVKTSPDVRPVPDIKAFLRRAENAALLVKYKLSAADELLELSKTAGAGLEAEARKAFVAAIDKARANALTISMPKTRNAVLSVIGRAYSYAGDDARAIDVARSIPDADCSMAVCKAVAESVENADNIDVAVSLSDAMRDGSAKNEFLLTLARAFARRNDAEKAVKSALSIPDISVRNRAFAATASAFARDAKNVSSAERALALIDVSAKDNSWFAELLDAPRAEISASFRDAYTAASAAEFLLGLSQKNAKIAEYANACAFDALEKAKNSAQNNKRELSDIATKACVNLARLGQASAAMDFIRDNIASLEPQSAFVAACEVALCADTPDLKSDCFERASRLCNAFSDEKNRVHNAVILADYLRRADMPDAFRAKVLESFLPKDF